MKWRSFGASGLKVTELCFGTMTLAGQADEATSLAILDAVWDGGIRFLDTADVYPVPLRLRTVGHTEALLGRWMRDRGNRDALVLATKAYFPTGPLPFDRGLSRRHLIAACEASLQRLGTDRLDLYLAHGWDETVPLEELLRAFEDLRRQGKILYAGLSNVRAHEVAAALLQAERLGVRGFEGLQPRYNLLQREAEESLLPLARRAGLGVMAYNPIAGGLLSGKHRPGAPPAEGTRFAMGEGTGDVYRERYWGSIFRGGRPISTGRASATSTPSPIPSETPLRFRRGTPMKLEGPGLPASVRDAPAGEGPPRPSTRPLRYGGAPGPAFSRRE